MSHREFRKFLDRCDRNNLMVSINRVHKKRFELSINYIIVKAYKTRISCKRYVIREFEKTQMELA